MVDAGVETVAAIADPMLPHPFRVTALRWELADTYMLDLEPIDGGAFTHQPGQIVMVYVYGAGEIPISISTMAASDGRISLTIRAAGSVSRAGARLVPGDVVGIRGPLGVPWPVQQARGGDVVVVAGGIGLAPLRSVIDHVLAYRADFENVALLYGARNPRSVLFAGDLHEWRGRFDMDVEVTVDRGDDQWHGDVGVVTHLIDRARFDPGATVAMVCGPEIMMRFVADGLRERGMSDDRIFLSLERNMKCAIGLCGHCQLGPEFICKDGPVFPLDRISRLLDLREV